MSGTIKTNILLCIVFNTVLEINGKAIMDHLFPLHIVHYNDFHSRFEETSVKFPLCKTNDSECLGGFPRLFHEIVTLKEQYPDALVLDAGDCFQGTYWYTILKWNVTQYFINMLPNDAHALGNHEFDDGIPGLVPYLKALKAPTLAANLDTSKEPTMEGLYQPHIIVERNGRKIGIIGLVTTETQTSSNPQKTVFLDPIPVVQREAELLKNQGVDIIIVLSHCGLEVDKTMAKTVGENIDIIVGGHTHSLLWNGPSPSNETISGPYPVLIESMGTPGHKVLVVTASAFTKYLGNITIYFDEHGELQSFVGSPIFLNRSIPEDSKVKELMDPIKEKLHDLVNEVVGYTNEDMILDTCASQECALGNLVTDAFMDLGKHVPTNLSHVAIILRANMRASIPKGSITRGTLINVSPFTNKVMSFILPGRHLLEALDRTMTNFWVHKPFVGPWIPHVAGLKLTLNATSGRTVSVLVREGDEYCPLSPDKDYRVVTLDFYLRGGSGFKMIQDNYHDAQHLGQSEKVVEEYVKKISPINPNMLLENRLTIVS
ncbi:hypothetical protein K1T71_011333 [Dendrolimus kikuchii]|uniref:Uncharacterized protein n=1 Tax=Dendrolimus kikuchii TaxID=765133 RepID=A0ACC1CNW0_9NEOP|nr:hypothetical protein K1T71_011333 [Dendrolimus kikuchii]